MTQYKFVGIIESMNRDVVISGGGPVGLMLACELRLAGVDVLVAERLPEPDQTIKAGSINLPTAEAFYRCGMLPALQALVQEDIARMQEFLKSRGAAWARGRCRPWGTSPGSW